MAGCSACGPTSAECGICSPAVKCTPRCFPFNGFFQRSCTPQGIQNCEAFPVSACKPCVPACVPEKRVWFPNLKPICAPKCTPIKNTCAPKCLPFNGFFRNLFNCPAKCENVPAPCGCIPETTPVQAAPKEIIQLPPAPAPTPLPVAVGPEA